MSNEAGSLDPRVAALPGSTLRIRPLISVGRQIFKELVKWPFYTVYERRLQTKAHTWRHPRHIGVIMDGNRRYARRAGLLSTLHGHKKGAEKLHELLRWCFELDIPVVTVWCFSIENFQRSAEEVQGLLDLFELKAREMAEGDEMHKRRVRVRFIGKLELLPESLRQEIRRVEEATRDYDQFELNVAMAYGGREEIADAVRRYVADHAEQGKPVDDILAGIDADSISRYLYTSGQPEPDLIIRTSGEVRLSGFLLWQSAYSEFYFCDATWPEFRHIDFLRGLRAYDQRQRRYGK